MVPRARLSQSSPGSAMSKEQFAAAAKRIEEQLATARANAERLDARVKEWEDLQSVLKDLPEKVRHPVMVPLGPLAFFEGYLEHTNEVLTQLSSEWFALRTVKQALAMADRRRARVLSDRSDVTKEVRELQERRKLALGAAGGNVSNTDAVPGEEKPVPGMPGATVRMDEDGFMDIREPFTEEDAGRQPSLPAQSPPYASTQLSASAGGGLQAAAATQAKQTIAETAEAAGIGADPVASSVDPVTRLRELERLEEMEQLDGLMASVEGEGGVGSATCGEVSLGPGTASTSRAPALDAERPSKQVVTPPDVSELMSQVDEACVQTPVSVPPELAPREFLQLGAASTAVAHSSPPVAVDRSGNVESAAAAFTGGINERIGQSASSLSGTAAGVLGRPSDIVGTAVSSNVGSEDAPKRVSKFKADRQRMRG